MPEYTKNKEKILRHFGIAIRARRDSLVISQEELAEKSGLHRTYIGGVEQGRRNLSLVNIIKIAKALETNPETLFSEMSRIRDSHK